MREPVVDQIWETMVDRIGEALRVVTQYEGTENETRMRDDVRNQYTADEDRDLITETIVDQLSERHIEAQFKTGGLEALIRVFESTWVVTWLNPDDWKAGILVSIQRDGSAATLEDAQACITYLTEEIEPRLSPT